MFRCFYCYETYFSRFRSRDVTLLESISANMNTRPTSPLWILFHNCVINTVSRKVFLFPQKHSSPATTTFYTFRFELFKTPLLAAHENYFTTVITFNTYLSIIWQLTKSLATVNNYFNGCQIFLHLSNNWLTLSPSNYLISVSKYDNQRIVIYLSKMI